MKKSIILLCLLTGSIGLSHAQDYNNQNMHIERMHRQGGDLKAESHSFTTEFGLTGGILNSEFHLNEGTNEMLRFRYFLHNGWALRLGFNVGVSDKKDNIYGIGPDEGRSGSLKVSHTSVLVNAGIEKHFEGTRRLSPYVGADIMIGGSSTMEKAENADAGMFLPDYTRTTKGPGSLALGLRAVVGADFYIAKHVYLGAEAGFGFLYNKQGESKTTISSHGLEISHTMKSPGNEFNLNPEMVTGVRIGFVF